VQLRSALDGPIGQLYGALRFRYSPGPSRTFLSSGGAMKNLDASRCAVCGARSVDTPRLSVEQDRHYDCPRQHAVGLCAEHGSALRAGTLTLHTVLYGWIQRNHDALYDGTRLYISPRLACLGCNSLLASSGERVTCAACGAVNIVGTALGHPAAVRLEP
jgi:hypothetical protein